MNIKNIILSTLLLVIAFPSQSKGWEDDLTHPAITTEALAKSNVKKYLNDIFSFNDFNHKLTTVPVEDGEKKTIFKLFSDGAKDEDKDECRRSNHFHNPVAANWEEGKISDTDFLMNVYCDGGDGEYFIRYSNLIWATGYQGKNDKLANPPNYLSPVPTPTSDYEPADQHKRNWDVAKLYFYNALISKDPQIRESLLADTFYTLGYVAHLLQDMAVPAHTRNDFSKGHLSFIPPRLGNPLENYVEKQLGGKPPRAIVSEAVQKAVESQEGLPKYSGNWSFAELTDLWDSDTYYPETDLPPTGTAIGLSEYSNANFVSFSTIFKSSSDDDHYFKYPSKESVGIGSTDHPEHPGNLQNITAANGRDGEAFFLTKDGEGVKVDKSLRARYIGEHLLNSGLTDYYSLYPFLDDYCYEEYAMKLLPYAVGYTASLFDYFFRGRLEISHPDRYVYGIVDDADFIGQGEQVFTEIKAKVRNVSGMGEVDAVTKLPEHREVVGYGELLAVARYKRRSDYLPDLSNDNPINTQNISSTYQYSLSAPVTIDNTNPITTEEMTYQIDRPFNFEADPIPAGITDLSLFVVFKGKIGTEDVDAVAVGSRDIHEPYHLRLSNSTDYFYNKNGSLISIPGTPHIFRVGFSPDLPGGSGFTKYTHSYTLEPGYYGKLIFLADSEYEEDGTYKIPQAYYLHIENAPPIHITSVTNPEKDSDPPNYFIAKNFRGMWSHYGFDYFSHDPILDFQTIYSDLYSKFQPIPYTDLAPVPATPLP